MLLTVCLWGGDGEMLLFALDRVHRQFAWKSGGLTQDHLGRRHPPSGVTIAGTMIHLAKVEEQWTAAAAGREVGPPLAGDEPWAAPGVEWEAAPRLAPEELYELWYLLDILEGNLLHTGQISLVREAIDGLVGNDPP